MQTSAHARTDMPNIADWLHNLSLMLDNKGYIACSHEVYLWEYFCMYYNLLLCVSVQ